MFGGAAIGAVGIDPVNAIVGMQLVIAIQSIGVPVGFNKNATGGILGIQETDARTGRIGGRTGVLIQIASPLKWTKGSTVAAATRTAIAAQIETAARYTDFQLPVSAVTRHIRICVAIKTDFTITCRDAGDKGCGGFKLAGTRWLHIEFEGNLKPRRSAVNQISRAHARITVAFTGTQQPAIFIIGTQAVIGQVVP